MHAREATQLFGPRIPWIVYGMDNALKNALGGMPNGELVLDPVGLVVAGRGWSDPNALPDHLSRAEGSLYLGFHLDPIYKVHWNNEASPLEWELETPTGVMVDSRRGIAPLVGPLAGGNGQLSWNEAPEFLKGGFVLADRNGDGIHLPGAAAVGAPSTSL